MFAFEEVTSWTPIPHKNDSYKILSFSILVKSLVMVQSFAKEYLNLYAEI